MNKYKCPPVGVQRAAQKQARGMPHLLLYDTDAYDA
jgi:hypothetical protein